MENYIKSYILDKRYYPSVNFDYQTGILVIEGESFMENAFSFYMPLIDWITKYLEERKTIILTIKLEYFNTSTSKMLVSVLKTCKHYCDDGGEVEVHWYHDADDTDMIDEVTDFMDESGMSITLIPNND